MDVPARRTYLPPPAHPESPMRARLDSPLARLYKPARFLVVAAAVWALPAWGESVGGVQLPDGAQKVGENRYRALGDFDGVVKYYKSVYPSGTFTRRSIVNQPGVKAVHIVNPSGKNFEGLNIYEANEEVRIYIVPVEKPVRKPGAK